MFSKILIVDDEANLEHGDVQKLLAKINEIGECFAKATDNISDLPGIKDADLLILDWDLTGSDPSGSMAKRIIKALLSERVTPVIIYTNYSEEQVKDQLNDFDPKIRDIITPVHKSEIGESLDKIKRTIEQSENLSLKVALFWKPIVNQALEKTLFSIFTTLNNEAMALVFRQFQLDRERMPEALKVLLSDLLFAELEPVEIGMEIDETEVPPQQVTRGYEAFKWLETIRRYGIPADGREVFTGDIFKIDEDTFGIVITPRCDLVRADNETFVKLLLGKELLTKIKGIKNIEEMKKELKKYLSGNHKANEYCLLYVPENTLERTIIFDFNQVMTYRLEEVKKQFKRITRLRSPYITDLMQGYLKHNLRVGVPAKPFNKGEERRAFLDALVEEHTRRYSDRAEVEGDASERQD